MLERIVNIAPGSDYKNSSAKTNRYHRTSQFLSELHSSLSDSVSLSPATSFLAGIKWRLKKFLNENEKYIITFDFDGFEFTAHVGQPDLVVAHNMEYGVKKIIERINSSYLSTLHFNAPHFYRENARLEVKENLPYLTGFVEDLMELNDMAYFIKADSIEVRKKFFEAEEKLRGEFEYLNKCLVGFLEKYLSTKFNPAVKSYSSSDVLALLRAQVEKI